MGLKLDSSTWRSYASAYNSWREFVSIHHFPIEPNPTTLSNYIMFMCDYIKPSSVTSYLSGIVQMLEPYFPNIRTVRSSPIVRDTLIGCKRLRNTPVTRKLPLSVGMIKQVVFTSDPRYDFVLFQTLIVVGFHGLLRLGDLCDPPIRSNINPAKRARRTSVKFPTNDSFSFALPAHKADPFFEGNVVLIRNLWSGIDVVSIFRRYLAQRDLRHPYASPLWLTENGSVPDRSFFIRFLLPFNFGPSVRGQSMRAGGATALAELGASSEAIQALGRWSSSAWKIYIRKHPTVVHHFERLHPNTPQHHP
uniref:Putative retroelement protein n=1 Tax=Coprinellus disseminatus TaxID=71703 RepID=Q1WMU6_COPDI|nr:putative retroelement protein [Coprinellus disseminatus]